jgi:hypothetical protein
MYLSTLESFFVFWVAFVNQMGCPALGIWVAFLKQPDALPARAHPKNKNYIVLNYF